MKRIVFDSYFPADESYPSSEESFRTFSGFVKDPEVAVYSFAGDEIFLEGKVLYSTWKCKKNIFGTYKPDIETVSDDEYQLLSANSIIKDIDLRTHIEPIERPQIQHGLYDMQELGAIAHQYRSISIHVSRAYSTQFYNYYRNRFCRVDLIKSVCSHFEEDCKNMSVEYNPFAKFELSDYGIYGFLSHLYIGFHKIGMQPLSGNLPKIAFLDCLLDYLRKHYNYGADFDSETIKLRFIEPKCTNNMAFLLVQPSSKKESLGTW